MGWGSFFAGWAADAAKDYVNKRGLGGMLEDAGNLKNKVTGIFSGNNNEDYSGDDSSNLWETIDAFLDEQDFHGAEVYVQNYFRNEGKNEFFYYAMAYIYNIKAVALDSHEDERKAKKFITNAVNMLNGDSNWRQYVYDLKRQIDDNLHVFKKEEKEIKEAQEWEGIIEQFELNSGCTGDEAITILEGYYNRTNKERDIYYHMLVFRGFEKLILEDNEPWEDFYDDMKTKAAIVLDLARSNPEEYGELAISMQERLKFLKEKFTTQESIPPSNNDNISSKEAEYIEELKVCYEDGVITDKERRLLDRIRKSLGISEVRSKELEAMCQLHTLTVEEQEYADEVKACLEADGVITTKERRLLDRLAKSLGISPDRAAEIEFTMQ